MPVEVPAELEAKNLAEIAQMLAAGTLTLDQPAFILQRRSFAPAAVLAATGWLRSLHQDGWTTAQAARFVGALAVERRRVEHARDDIELVWTGPDAHSSENRDSARVLEEMFVAATGSVLMCGYNIQPGPHFDALARAIKDHPKLRVRWFTHVFTDHQPSFADALRAHDAGLRAVFGPNLRARIDFFRPSNALVMEAMARRFSVHAKCVVVDGRRLLVTSANFSTAAQERNIEVGLTLDDARLAAQLRDLFNALVSRGDMVPHHP
jgi:phosphatidylserine/phosphatidylglycerophosphate/cardiolipin synthase-like enzyme